MLPSIFGENLFDDFFDDDFFRMPAWTGRDPLYGKRGKNLMKTDVRETDTSYELDVDLPGFKKDAINVDLQNRSFYVGDIQPDQVSAKYEDGILKISLPKQEKRELPKQSTIAIEG